MTASVKDLHNCAIGGCEYWFRTPTALDKPKLRRQLTRQGIRRPHPAELRVAAMAGIAALAEVANDPGEGMRQVQVMEEWYRLLEPIREDDIDEPDFEKRAVLLADQERARVSRLGEMLAETSAIEANLTRHWSAYSELLADQTYWDEVSQVEVVRLLLARIGDAIPERDADGMLSDASYVALPSAHKPVLAAFASRLMMPDEVTRKN